MKFNAEFKWVNLIYPTPIYKKQKKIGYRKLTSMVDSFYLRNRGRLILSLKSQAIKLRLK